jgi:L-asparaginase
MVYPPLGEQVRFVLHESYHSGTINTEHPHAIRFFEEAKEKGIPVFLTGVGSGLAYESTREYKRLALRPLPEMSPIAAYVKLWMLSAGGLDPVEWMRRSLGGDIV